MTSEYLSTVVNISPILIHTVNYHHTSSTCICITHMNTHTPNVKSQAQLPPKSIFTESYTIVFLHIYSK